MTEEQITKIREKLSNALGADGILLGDNEVAALILLCDLYIDLDTAVQDFKCARTTHHNAVPEEKGEPMEIYNNIIFRLEAILDIEKRVYR